MPHLSPSATYAKGIHPQKRVEEGQSVRDIHGGKRFFANLSARLQVEFGTSISALAVCKEAKLVELCDELRDFVSLLCAGTKVEPGKFNMEIE